jgi:hypothetical protein
MGASISFETSSCYPKIMTHEPTHERAVRSRPNRWVDTLGDVLEVQRINRGRSNPRTQRTMAKKYTHSTCTDCPGLVPGLSAVAAPDCLGSNPGLSGVQFAEKRLTKNSFGLG